MYYRTRIYRAVPENLEIFHKFFLERLLPIQKRHGARLVGRWQTEDERVVAVWEYDSPEHYQRVHARVAADPDAIEAQEYRRQLPPLVLETEEFFMRSTLSDDRLVDVLNERAALGRAICEAAYLEGSFVLRSGQRSGHYFDKYQFESDPALLRRISDALIPLIPSDAEILAGLELGGVPVVTALGLATGLPVVFVRKVAKSYGTEKLAEGPSVCDRSVVIVEDVVTSGGQIAESSVELAELGASVTHALCVIDREAGGREALAEVGVELHPLFVRSELAEWLPSGESRPHRAE